MSVSRKLLLMILGLGLLGIISCGGENTTSTSTEPIAAKAAPIVEPTLAPPTATSVPPTATAVRPTATAVPPTAPPERATVRPVV